MDGSLGFPALKDAGNTAAAGCEYPGAKPWTWQEEAARPSQAPPFKSLLWSSSGTCHRLSLKQMLRGGNKGPCLFPSASACWEREQSLSVECALLLLPVLICCTAEPVTGGGLNVEGAGTGSCAGCQITSQELCQDPYQPHYASAECISGFPFLTFFSVTGIAPTSMSGNNRNVRLFYLWLAHLLDPDMFWSLSFRHHPALFKALSFFGLFTLPL